MADFTRRGFLTQMSVTTGIGIAGGLGLHRLLASDTSSPSTMPASVPQSSSRGSAAPQPSLDNVTLAGPMLIHIRDVPSAEVSMMVGTRELIYHDPELVSRLVQTAASARSVEA
jgi:hypothetical protein